MSRVKIASFTRAQEYEKGFEPKVLPAANCPLWLEAFADQMAQKEKTAVEVARERNDSHSIYNQMNALMGNFGSTPKFSSVEEVVSDIRDRLGLSDYLKKVKSKNLAESAKKVLAAAETDKPPSVDPNNQGFESFYDSISDLKNYENGFSDNLKKKYKSLIELLETISNAENTALPNLILAFDNLFAPLINEMRRDNPVLFGNVKKSLETVYSYVKKLNPNDNSFVSKAKKKEYNPNEGVPEIIERIPAVGMFIKNLIETNYGIQLPAIQQEIASTFNRDGVRQQDADDPDLARYINLLLTDRHLCDNLDYSNLGRGVGVQRDYDTVQNPFQSLMPARNTY